ncbi:hypothetical protein [uncultured Tateyamaria sp.]|uniref:hypothetical protein n=1 Tax=uncultured Tateyamaria sp. TaxID=455651 RepID=UPI00260D8329|nr:hypothetical protein [uncultured Tateyamaria sp.]
MALLESKRVTKKANKRSLLIAFALSFGSALVFLAAALSDTLFTEMTETVRNFVLVLTFFAMCGVLVFLGPLGIGPHMKKMLPKDSLGWKALWFVPDLEE